MLQVSELLTLTLSLSLTLTLTLTLTVLQSAAWPAVQLTDSMQVPPLHYYSRCHGL